MKNSSVYLVIIGILLVTNVASFVYLKNDYKERASYLQEAMVMGAIISEFYALKALRESRIIDATESLERSIGAHLSIVSNVYKNSGRKPEGSAKEVLSDIKAYNNLNLEGRERDFLEAITDDR